MYFMARMPDPRAKVIEDLLFRLDLSNRWLADKVQRSHATVGDWLKGEAKPQKQEVWDQMLAVLTEYEQEANKSGNLKVRRARRLTLPVLLSTQDMGEGLNYPPTDVYQESVVVTEPDDGRTVWPRKVPDTKILPLARPGDILVFDGRTAEIGHIVAAWCKGETLIRVLGGTPEKPTLITTNPNHPETIDADFTVRGVAYELKRRLPGGVVGTLEYEFGLRYIPGDSLPSIF